MTRLQSIFAAAMLCMVGFSIKLEEVTGETEQSQLSPIQQESARLLADDSLSQELKDWIKVKCDLWDAIDDDKDGWITIANMKDLYARLRAEPKLDGTNFKTNHLSYASTYEELPDDDSFEFVGSGELDYDYYKDLPEWDVTKDVTEIPRVLELLYTNSSEEIEELELELRVLVKRGSSPTVELL